MEDASGGAFTPESVFAFIEAQHVEIVMGYTILLSNRLQQAGFDAALNEPEFLAKWLGMGMGATSIDDPKELADLDGIGEASVGLTAVANMSGISMRMDLVIFRRGIAGAYVMAMYIDGDVPVVSVGDVASKLDARIVTVLQSGA